MSSSMRRISKRRSAASSPIEYDSGSPACVHSFILRSNRQMILVKLADGPPTHWYGTLEKVGSNGETGLTHCFYSNCRLALTSSYS
uniref:Uncharacterized protein n=1 Tax=Pyxicephalus adspersus TaxID=30357 RepID=A0AAV3A200_PYXAD|nr:TPA: hypothetical protein GDO54_016708 [Pyxicephalus adspersus]